ncbi:hypothetical protein FA95DRAFT_1675016 [Auriscalpium vulgare]|uniref:Uncharacterized protein n=1 Tax=Auriscalpium vulgare TaxID=40419 RepID=A0ACB8S9Q8_9AGAM|nr:hypothetical protein FA95DRAFT_1675016 [Auriscalpium vulgare]
MLPQVANHIFHHTTRAVAAAQNQAGHTLRNVLGLQSTGAPSTSTSLGPWNGAGSSNWGNGPNGAGGGAKYHTGGRFYAGYTGPGRAITQANAASVNDPGATQPDDSDDVRAQPPIARSSRKPRSRRHSFSLGSDAHAQSERAESIGVLQAVQMHSRSRHAFAEPPRPHNVPENVAKPEDDEGAPRLSRRNSTASTVSLSSAKDIHEPPPPPRPTTALDPSDLAQPQTVLPPYTPPAAETSESPPGHALDGYAVRAELERLRDPDTKSTLREWNEVLQNLVASRAGGESASVVLEAYNDMVARSLKPNLTTYHTLLEVLTKRDQEVHFQTKSIRTRISWRKQIGVLDDAEDFVDEQRIQSLAAENNFASAISLFRAANAVPNWLFNSYIYTGLLRCCSYHRDVDSAIFIFAHIERRNSVPPSATIYGQLVSVYMARGDNAGAQVVFEEFRRVCEAGLIRFVATREARAGHITVWNRAIESHLRSGNATAALGLLEQMLDSKAGAQFGPADVPLPAFSTYRHLLRGFWESGDVATALAWFHRLLEQGAVIKDDFQPTVSPPRPDLDMWDEMLTALAETGRIDELNDLYKSIPSHCMSFTKQLENRLKPVVYAANIGYLRTHDIDDARAVEILDFLESSVIGHRFKWGSGFREIPGLDVLRSVVELFTAHGRLDKALAFVDKLDVVTPSKMALPSAAERTDTVKDWSMLILYDNGVARDLPLSLVLGLVETWSRHGLHLEQTLASAVSRAYVAAKETAALDDLSPSDWDVIAQAMVETDAQTTEELVQVEERAEPLEQRAELGLGLFTDMARAGLDPNQLSSPVQDRLVAAISASKASQELFNIMVNLGPSFVALLERRNKITTAQPEPVSSTPSLLPPGARIDDYHTRFVDEFIRGSNSKPLAAFERFESGIRMGLYPSSDVIGRLIESLGRLKDMKKVEFLYEEGNKMLSLLDYDQQVQMQAWAALENSMIIARGHAGDGLTADLHRSRLLEQGMSPTADAYGALIQCIKDTTDDTARAMAYFDESQMRGIRPNTFLYNTTISKLAKARKADYAIELFHSMKSSGLQPTSITYGALIAACCRVGDSASAETLFEEMTQQPNFKPRVPPFNTMMQFYVQTKPNRARFLYFYSRMVSACIKPTAHTYKLLLDAHGSIEPVDFKSMEKTFAQLQRDRSVQVQGSHWAALVNAYGCVKKDLDKAITVFDSIATHPSTLSSGLQLPDAVTYESLINVFVTLRRADLMPAYIARLRDSGIHMTAYIANILIRGYAAVGDVEQARLIFESLVDPPVGVAAPNNHTPHDTRATHFAGADDPVYREPSTWEAMVRAELGSGNRDHAIALLERVRSRQYPESIYNRISGIMLDDSVSPWPSEPSASVTASTASHSP